MPDINFVIDYCQKLIQDLDEQILTYSTDICDPIILAETVIHTTLQKVAELKTFIQKEGFENQEAEIIFFKELKPKVVSKLILYNAIYKIENRRPHGGGKTIKKYLNNELSKLRRFFDNNLEFYKYHRTNSTYLDHKYFVRGNFDIKLNLDTYYFESDQTFATSHDYKVAKIIANDLIQVYLEDQILNIKKIADTRHRQNDTAKLHWTGSKSSLTELIYALYAAAVFEHGNADIKTIARVFETTFCIDLGDIYHTYMEIKNRKVNRTKFLDFLKEDLLRRMEDQD